MKINKISFVYNDNQLILNSFSVNGNTLKVSFKKIESISSKTCIIISNNASKYYFEVDYNSPNISSQKDQDGFPTYVYSIEVADTNINLDKFVIHMLSYNELNEIVGRSSKQSSKSVSNVWVIATKKELDGRIYEISFPDGVPTLTLLNNDKVSANSHLGNQLFLLSVLPVMYELLLRNYIFTENVKIESDMRDILLNDIGYSEVNIEEIINNGEADSTIEMLVTAYMKNIKLINGYSNKLEEDVIEYA